MEEEVVKFEQELADLNMQENTFLEVEEGIGEVKETDEFYKGGVEEC